MRHHHARPRNKPSRWPRRHLMVVSTFAVAFSLIYASDHTHSPSGTSGETFSKDTSTTTIHRTPVALHRPDDDRIVVKFPQDVCSRAKRNTHYEMRGQCSSRSLGNELAEVYLTALNAFQLDSTFSLNCSKGSFQSEVMPGSMIWDVQLKKSVPNLCETCNTSGPEQGPGHIYPHNCRQGLNNGIGLIKDSLRRLQKPPQIDDLVIHMRCGDVLGFISTKMPPAYGYPRYKAYEDVLGMHKHDIASIGIITSTFDLSKARSDDASFIDTCKVIIYDAVEYLQASFSNASVTIRNTDATISQPIARMVHAKFVWCSPSTFCLYPALATTGEAFILKSQLYPFVEEILDEPHIHVVDLPFLPTRKIYRKRWNANDIVAWLRGEGK